VASITLLAVLSLLVSGMPPWMAYPLAAWAAWSGWRGTRREWNRPAVELVFPGDGLPAIVDGKAVEGMCIEWRGPLAFAKWNVRPGEMRRLAWWPDTLPARSRRELRLAASGNEAARPRS